MNKLLQENSKKVQEFLLKKGSSYLIREFPSSTHTAAEAAEVLGCSVSQIAKSLIFKNKKTGMPVLVVASGSNMVSTSKIWAEMGINLVKADASFVKKSVGYPIGGVPPIGHTQKVLTVLDIDLKNYDEIWAAAGTPNTVFKLKGADLEYLTGGHWLNLAKS